MAGCQDALAGLEYGALEEVVEGRVEREEVGRANALLGLDLRKTGRPLDGGIDIVSPEDVLLGALGAERLEGVRALGELERTAIAVLGEVRVLRPAHAPARASRR